MQENVLNETAKPQQLQQRQQLVTKPHSHVNLQLLTVNVQYLVNPQHHVTTTVWWCHRHITDDFSS